MLCGTVLPAHAFLWESSSRRWIREADQALEAGRKAETEQRIMDACDAFSRAHELYLKAQKESPGTRTDHVAAQDAECRTRLRTLFARAATGAVATPPPEEVLPSAPAEGPVEAVATAETDAAEDAPPLTSPPQKPRRLKGLVALPSDDSASTPPDPAAAETPNTERRTWLGRLFRGPAKRPTPNADGPETETEGTASELPTAPAQAPAPPARTVAESALLVKPSLPKPAPPRALPPPAATLSDAVLSRKIQAMLADGAGADAVMLLESIVEDPDREPTLAQQLLFVQALMNRHNYVRAERVLAPLLESHGDDPSCAMLGAGLRLAQGQPVAALRLLDRLVEKYPRYADAYIDLAYTRFAMDPVENRDEAIKYYRNALVLGADRDPRLEMELRISIEP